MSQVETAAIVAWATEAARQRWPEARIDDIRPLEGGHSGLTFVAEVVGGPADVSRVVLKLAPPGRPAEGRHDVLRQARLLSALSEVPGVRVPPIHFTLDGEPPLFAMGWVDGEALEPILDAPDEVRPADEVDARARAAARMLAALHAADPQTVAPGETFHTVEDELERWQPTMAAIDPDLRPRAPELQQRLAANVPDGAAPAVIHGDYRLGNVLCHGPEARAIIDWEIWSVGDPRVDLGWFLVFTDDDHLPGAAAPAEGMPSAAELRAEYEDSLGEPVRAAPWFDALARYKMAAIMGHNLKRHREGRYHDPYQERLPESILSLVDQGIRLLS